MTLTGHQGGAEITFWILLDTVTQGLAASAGTGLGDKGHAALLCGHREPAGPPLGCTEQWAGGQEAEGPATVQPLRRHHGNLPLRRLR